MTGGRDYTNHKRVFEVLSLLKPKYLILGDANGADSLARKWAVRNFVEPQDKVAIAMGLKRITHYMICFADWKRLGRSAGPKRNSEMLDAEPDFVLAFPGGRGTQNMITQAKSRGIPVRLVDSKNG